MLLAALVISHSPASAEDAWLRGSWCSNDGERMVIERSGPGFNEHTICRWTEGMPGGKRVNTRIACANVYGDGQKAGQMLVRFRAVQTGPRTASVRIGSGTATAYSKC